MRKSARYAVSMFSGGLGSWAATRRWVDQHGTQGLTLLFTDTRMEDEDLYRFLREAAADIGVPLSVLADGRTPFDVFEDERAYWRGADPCSKILKRDVSWRWLRTQGPPPRLTTLIFGIDWTESHRMEGVRRRWKPRGYTVSAPLTEAPYTGRSDHFAELERRGIARPRLYDMGFAHNNCGGYCLKAGQDHFVNLLRRMPERYAEFEEREQRTLATMRERGMRSPRGVITKQMRGIMKRFTLREWRLFIEAGGDWDAFEVGGCGCFA